MDFGIFDLSLCQMSNIQMKKGCMFPYCITLAVLQRGSHTDAMQQGYGYDHMINQEKTKQK